MTIAKPNAPNPRPIPWFTLTILIITAIPTGLAVAIPSVLLALERQPQALAAGEWWRIVTPLLVHDGGWVQIVFNALTLVVVGIAAERAFSRPQWLGLYLAGGLVGEVAGYAWQPMGAGNSVACAGLIGGLFFTLLRQQKRVEVLPALYSLYFVAILTGEAIGLIGAVILSVIMILGFWALTARLHDVQKLLPWLAGAGLLCALTLCLVRDIHGPPVLVGAGLAWLMDWGWLVRN